MNTLIKPDIDSILIEISSSLDISDSLAEEAVNKYQAVSNWLSSDQSILASLNPQIYPQGSFQLGTVIRPINDEDDYDIDLVLELSLSKNQTTQEHLKNMVGDRLKESGIYRELLDTEGKRCWTLQYEDRARFHLDILPSIPDGSYLAILQKQNLPFSHSETTISITDRTWPTYKMITQDWPRSNPKGYAIWFKEQMKSRYYALRKQIAESLKAEIEKVPEYKIKTPLQRSIQLLKRHRDIYFSDDQDNKPASIIITTLAAQAYNNEYSLSESLKNIAKSMSSFIGWKNGEPWIPNPVDPVENFADRWKLDSQQQNKFFEWLENLDGDIESLFSLQKLEDTNALLEKLFGKKVTNIALNKIQNSVSPINTFPEKIITIQNPAKPWGIRSID